MAGSLVYRQYISDSGITYAQRCDESNARASVTGGNAAGLSPVLTANVPGLPRGIGKRYVLAQSSANPNIRRKFWIGNPANVASLLLPGATITAEDYPGAGDTPGANATFIVTAYRGEKQTIVPAFNALDTGLTDGTPGQ